MKSILANVHIKRIAEGEGTINMTQLPENAAGGTMELIQIYIKYGIPEKVFTN